MRGHAQAGMYSRWHYAHVRRVHGVALQHIHIQTRACRWQYLEMMPTASIRTCVFAVNKLGLHPETLADPVAKMATLT